MDEQKLIEALDKLNEAQELLANAFGGGLDVIAFNATPAGQVGRYIQDAIDLLQGASGT